MMNDTAQQQLKNTTINLQNDIGEKLVVHKNIEQEIIIINIDRMKWTLKDHIDGIKSQDNWKEALAIFIALFLAVLTSTFHDFMWLEAAVWKAIFIICTIASFLYLLKRVYYAAKIPTNIDDLIDKLKKHAKNSNVTKSE